MPLFSTTLVIGEPYSVLELLQSIESFWVNPSSEVRMLASRLGPGRFSGYYRLNLPASVELVPDSVVEVTGSTVRHEIFTNESDASISLVSCRGVIKVMLLIRDVEKPQFFDSVESALSATALRDGIELQNVHECYGSHQLYLGRKPRGWQPSGVYRPLVRIGVEESAADYWIHSQLEGCYICQKTDGTLCAQHPRSMPAPKFEEWRRELIEEVGNGQ